MKATLIYPIRYRFKSEKAVYLPGDSQFELYDQEPVFYPINHIIKGLVNSSDEIEVILVQTISETRTTDEYVDDAKKEIYEKLSSCNENIKFKIVKVPFASTKEGLGEAYKKIRSSITPNSNIYADLTFGAKYMPLILFCVFNYAEKYLSCEIKKLYYGFYEGDNSTPNYIVDFTTLYLLNNFGIMFDGTRSSFDSFSDTILK